ncbi:hypothetical protein BDR06DRAFT_1045508, partial [Suillus hirtellus]
MQDLQKVVPTICSLDPRGTTSRVCLKSPPKSMVIPPKSASTFRRTCHVRSRHSRMWWCNIGILSQMIREVALRSS